jgi:hypothetical protein
MVKAAHLLGPAKITIQEYDVRARRHLANGTVLITNALGFTSAVGGSLWLDDKLPCANPALACFLSAKRWRQWKVKASVHLTHKPRRSCISLRQRSNFSCLATSNVGLNGD